MKNQKTNSAFSSFSRMFCIAIIFLVLNTTIAFAEDNAAPETGSEIPNPEITDNVATVEFQCKNPSTAFNETVLLPQQVNALRNAIQNTGVLGGVPFTGKERLTPEQDKNNTKLEDRKKLDNSGIVVPTGIGKDAYLNTMPEYKFSPGEAPVLNEHGFGPFAIGISLDDSLRVGRCENLGTVLDENYCPVTDKRLQLRNSGSGITQDFKSVWTDLKDWIGVGEDMQENYTPDQYEDLRAQAASDIDKEATYSEAKRIQGEIIPNSIKTQYFSAEIGSNCTTSACQIGAYSSFDKYFNSWFSADIVINGFGPTLFGQAKRYLGTLGRRGWPWNISNNKFVTEFRKSFLAPDSLLGKARVANMNTRIDKYGFGEYRKALWEGSGWQEGYGAIKGGSTRKMLDDWLKAGGKIETEITDPVRRGEFFKLVKEWKGIADTHSALAEEAFSKYSTVLRKYGVGSIEEKAALIEFAQTNSKLMRQLDNMTRLDMPEYWAKEPIAGLYNKGIMDAKTGEIIEISGDSTNINAVMQKFEADGHWGNWDQYLASGQGTPEKFYATTPEGFLKLYQPDPTGKLIDSIAFEDLQKNFSRFQDKMAQLENGTFLKIDSTTMPLIAKQTGTGNVKVYEMAWKETDAMTPEKFAGAYTRGRARNRLSRQPTLHTTRLYNALIEKGWAGQNRRYLSLLDKALSQEEDILKSYFSIKGGAKWTVTPYLYWGLKRGVGVEGLSAYQLPDSWRATKASLGDTTLYSDAYMDFFANEGSDDGDMFARVLNVLPWKMVLNEVSDNFSPIPEAYDKYTGRGLSGYRNETENLALFSQTGDECATCGWTLGGKGINYETGVGDSSLNFNSRDGLSSIMLEDVLSDEAKEKGSTIISFAHHTNLSWEGPEKTEDSSAIDLVQAARDGDTCRQRLEDTPLLGFFGKIVGGKPQRAGAILGVSESLLYFAFGWPGIMGSVIQQVLVAQEMQDCVDDAEGYYLHLFAPAKEEQKKQESASQIASEKASSEVIKNLNNVLGSPENDKSRTFLDVVKDKVREESQKLSDKADAKSIVQATIEAKNFTTGSYFGKQLFFFWFKGETNASKYDNQTKTLVKDPNSDISVLFDNQKGEISVNGNPIITSPDHVRLAAPNGLIPAEEIPQRLTKITLPRGSQEPLFRMGINAEMAVITSNEVGKSVFDCIKQGVLEQTGVPLNSENLSDAFGKVKAIVSDTHPNIVPDELSKTITAEGTPRELAYGADAFALVKANREVELWDTVSGPAKKTGRMDSIQFENGVIVYKPETNELLVWLKHHDKAILSQNDVAGLIAKPTTVKNPETNCEEPAIDLEAVGKPGSDAIAKKISNFNDSMELMGPFQVFDTDTHRYIFYSKLVGDECKDYFKSINKKTGEVYDQEIQGPIEKTPTGVKFTTADGKQHTLDFGVDNGAPTISYNGQPAEILKTATGPNGSFWYDPSTGNWYPENAQLIPLDDAFRQKGFSSAVGADGKVSQTPGGNPLTVNVGSGTGMPFNLPSLPEGTGLFIFVILLLGVIMAARIKIERVGQSG